MERPARTDEPPPSGGVLAPALDILHRHQDVAGYLSEAAIMVAAGAAGRSPAELYSAVTTYPRFRLSAGAPADAVCTGPACRMRGHIAVLSSGATDHGTHCLGLCDQPVAVLTRDGPRIVWDPPREPSVLPPVAGVAESAFFGDDDPADAVRAALAQTPEAVIDAVAGSGLLGRGGAAFPAGKKWAMVRAAPGDRKFIVCNADESEPGTFKDRYILDHQPRRLLAGMVIAAHATSATAGIIYIRDEYRAQRESLETAIEGMRAAGLLGRGFDVVLRRGAGSYVCGEETALLNSLEGRRPVPHDRPPYPTASGLYGAPTLIQNVETLAAVPAIVFRGAAWFMESGSPKLYCVSGDVPAPGVFELPMGITAGELMQRAGADLAEIKAFTLGGLSGGLLPSPCLDVRLDATDPGRYGAALGSGGVIVLGISRCVVRFTVDAMRFFAGESCGKCFPCRIGTTRLLERLQAAPGMSGIDLTEMRDIVDLLATGSACGLGHSAGLIARHLLEQFPHEVEAHRHGRCPPGECEAAVA